MVSQEVRPVACRVRLKIEFRADLDQAVQDTVKQVT